MQVTKAKIDEIPCIFPASREFGFRDEFAPDCPLQRGVRCEPDSSDQARRLCDWRDALFVERSCARVMRKDSMSEGSVEASSLRKIRMPTVPLVEAQSAIVSTTARWWDQPA